MSRLFSCFSQYCQFYIFSHLVGLLLALFMCVHEMCFQSPLEISCKVAGRTAPGLVESVWRVPQLQSQLKPLIIYSKQMVKVMEIKPINQTLGL